ncbi:MAG: hypothetical protein ACFE0O_03275 [Opitutales bacterium]
MSKSLSFLRRHLAFFILVPGLTAIAGFYLYGIARDVYVAEAQFIIKQNDNAAPRMEMDIPLLNSGGSSTSKEDALILKEYIRSLDMLSKLEERLGLREHYSAPRWDFWQKLDEDSSETSFLAYYREQIKVTIDPDSSIVKLRVRAFTPDMALFLAQAIVEESEVFINTLSRDLAEKLVTFAEDEMRQAEIRLARAKDALNKFQAKTATGNPTAVEEALVQQIATLENQKSQKEIELRSARRLYRENAPQVQQILNEIDSINQQLTDLNQRLIGLSGNESAEIRATFEKLELDVTFAENAYATATTSLANAQIDASRQLKFVVVVSNPSLPDEAVYPERGLNLLTIAVVLLVAYGIGKLILATIQDHVD